MKIWIVDAFTKHPFTGNPAGVMLFDQWPEDQFMLNIAAELNFSNSAFLVKLSDHRYHIRWFTPTSEAPLCGHATIASTKVLASLGEITSGKEVIFESLSGELSVIYSDGLINLNLPLYEPKPLQLTPELLDIVGGITPIYNGLAENCLFMEFQLSELLNMQPNLELLMQQPYRGLIICSEGDGKYDFMTRYFAPKVGILEDPVCGSSYSRLVPYWSAKLGKDNMLAYSASKRGGVINCQKLQNRILLSTQAVILMEGRVNNFFDNELKNVA